MGPRGAAHRAQEATVIPLDQFGPRTWARPEITGLGRIPTASPLRSSDRVDLDGTWHFRLRERPEAVTEADIHGPCPEPLWHRAEVPGCWTMQGFDRPQYTNISMPFPGPPVTLPDDNPTGVYRRTVTVPDDWADRRVVLHVGGAESVLYVHIDGRPVGMGKDSRLPSEFDITAFVRAGRPFDLALTVVRWSDATYLEDQDHWYHAGLHRSVYCYSTPTVYIADVHAVADFDPGTRTGRLRAKVTVDAPDRGPRRWQVRATVCGQSTRAPARFEHPTHTIANMALFEGRGAVVEIDAGAVDPWSAEQPSLYPLTVELVDDEGNTVDRVSLRVGFRRVEVRGADLLVNGARVLIKGVNRHDHDARRGKAVTPESIEHDIVLMKRHNLNAVRTSHYPSDSHLYDQCDELGVYVLDEANVETHAFLRSLTRDPRWTGAILERITRMAMRDKNHPSVIMWSLGNESGVSAAHQAAAAWLRRYDGTRPVHYEGGISEDMIAAQAGGQDPDLAEVMARPRPESDVVAPMYPPVEALVRWATQYRPERPLIMCEYIHAMGNSCGGLDRYWDAIRTLPGLQGGFVWDWVDQALVQSLPDGSERLAYGGDFGDTPNDGPFCLNGLVATDRRPHPSLLELAKVVQPVQFRALDAARGLIEVRNEHAFVDLGWLTTTWHLEVDGDRVAEGNLDLPGVPPGAAVTLRAPLPAPALAEGQVATLTVEMRASATGAWAPAGHLVAWEQFEVERAPGPAHGPRREEPEVPDLEALSPQLYLWRAPIDNEVFGPAQAERWDHWALRDAGDRVAMDTTTEAAADGGLVVAHTVTIPESLSDVARVGVRLRLGPGVESVEWLGLGPHECYSDRRASGRLGRYRTSVDDWPVPYVHPQASGNREGVRWLRFLDHSGRVVLVIDWLEDLSVTVSRFTDEDLDAASHLEDLPTSNDCFVWIDARHRGVGSGAVGPDVAAAHRVGPGTYRWRYRLG
ncbi:MAG TPA: glycoside hydrolase family 2 TIM barrel-domain containing protein [Acidimicrobiales bacterium]|nr:glycoside hydrolase family 2 TIM barrel-domain containing protein [Acidimicrobiales bacterium]